MKRFSTGVFGGLLLAGFGGCGGDHGSTSVMSAAGNGGDSAVVSNGGASTAGRPSSLGDASGASSAGADAGDGGSAGEVAEGAAAGSLETPNANGDSGATAGNGPIAGAAGKSASGGSSGSGGLLGFGGASNYAGASGSGGSSGAGPVHNTATAVSFGGCAVTSGGAVDCWGITLKSQYATATAMKGLTSGAQAVTGSIAGGCALLSGGSVQCWGYNDAGWLGNGTLVDSADPVPVSGLSAGVTALASSYLGSAECAVNSQGGVVCWGSNSTGQLGTTVILPSCDGFPCSSVPIAVDGLDSGIKSVSVGAISACALSVGGAVECWGDNAQGQLGNGTTVSSPTPVPVTGLGSGVSAVSVGYWTTCALKTDGSVLCWGSNAYGELGATVTLPTCGTGIYAGPCSLTPIAATALTSGVKAISLGTQMACAILETGAAVCWGINNQGQLGSGGSVKSSSSPVQVKGLTSGVTAIAASSGACAVVADGGVQCWGTGGDVASGSSSVPVPVKGF